MSSNSSFQSVSTDDILDLYMISHLIIFAISFSFNSLLLYVTVANKSLNGPCNVLIALEGVLNLNREFAYAFQTVKGIFGSFMFKFNHCCALQMFTTFSNESAVISMLMIASDRTSAIIAPNWYRKWTQRKVPYCLIFLSLCVVNYSVRFTSIINTIFDDGFSQKQVLCYITSCASDFTVTYSQYKGLILYLLTISVYAIFFVTYRLLKVKVVNKNKLTQAGQHVEQQHQITRRIYTALIALCSVYTVGVMMNLYALAIQKKLIFASISPAGNYHLTNIYSLINSIINASYVPLLFICSSVYREAAKSALKILFKINNLSDPSTIVRPAIASLTIRS